MSTKPMLTSFLTFTGSYFEQRRYVLYLWRQWRGHLLRRYVKLLSVPPPMQTAGANSTIGCNYSFQ